MSDAAPDDPYTNYRFRIKWDGRYVAGVSKVGSLTRRTEVITHRAGSDPTIVRKVPGQAEYEPITLERGVTHDVEFQRWAREIWDAADGETSLDDFRKDIRIDLYDEAGRLKLSYVVHRAWVSEYQALPDLDAGANAVAIEHMKLEHEGWTRDPP